MLPGYIEARQELKSNFLLEGYTDRECWVIIGLRAGYSQEMLGVHLGYSQKKVSRILSGIREKYITLEKT